MEDNREAQNIKSAKTPKALPATYCSQLLKMFEVENLQFPR